MVDLQRYLVSLQPRPTWGSWVRGVTATALQVTSSEDRTLLYSLFTECGRGYSGLQA